MQKLSFTVILRKIGKHGQHKVERALSNFLFFTDNTKAIDNENSWAKTVNRFRVMGKLTHTAGSSTCANVCTAAH